MQNLLLLTMTKILRFYIRLNVKFLLIYFSLNLNPRFCGGYTPPLYMRLESKTATIPFNPRRVPFFYGWVILGLSSLGMLLSIPGQTMGVSVFTDYLIEALGLSRVAISLAYMFGTICSALVLPRAGRLLDRTGARYTGAAVTAFLGLTLLGMSMLDKAAGALGGLFPFIRAWIFSFVLVSIGFFLMRLMGQGILTLTSRNMAMKWFSRKRGFANVFIGITVSFGFSYAPRLFHSIIQAVGWRGAWLFIGLFLIVLSAPLFWLLARDNPYICGMVPDLKTCGTAGVEGAAGTEEAKKGEEALEGYTLEEAKAQLDFWVYALSLMLFGLFITAMSFHVVSIFAEAGMSEEAGVGVFLPAAVISLFVNVSASWLSDRMPLKVFLLLLIGGILLEAVALSFLQPGLMYILVITGHGISGGLMNLISTVVWPKHFGIKHLGAISGFAMGLVVAGSALGPYLFSLSLRYGGSYSTACWISVAAGVVIFILSLLSKRPPAVSSGAGVTDP